MGLTSWKYGGSYSPQTRPTSVRRNHAGISLVARFGLEIGNLAKGETFGGNVVDAIHTNREAAASIRLVLELIRA
jgi:hypothetical protein